MRVTTFNTFLLTLGTVAVVNAETGNKYIEKRAIDLSRERDPNFFDNPDIPVPECFWFMFKNNVRQDDGTCYSSWKMDMKVGPNWVHIKSDDNCNLSGDFPPGWIVLGKKRPGF
uniref:AVR-Pik n=1 Tax=Pyricularia oryzae TaxID=318829 RepID=A0A4P8W787_PYROR|nr:AVR-Pik [Pyricularia oryzae]